MADRVVTATATLAVLTVAGYYLFQALAPEMYMDEVFHVPQTQRYCAGRWAEWHEKITTFPGLYLLGVAFARTAHALGVLFTGVQGPEYCGTAVLRTVNAVFAVACLPLLCSLARVADESRSKQQAVMLALACAIFPLHYFYSFLFYTDVPSTFFVLATYLATKQRRAGATTAALATAAVLMRQTNAVWVAFMAAEAALDRCQPSRRGAGAGAKERQRGVAGLQALLWATARQAWLLRWELLRQLWGHMAVAAAFAAFVGWNKGVVVGDRAHHAPVRHLMQPLYFALYTALWLGPATLSPEGLWRAARGVRSAGPGIWAAWAAGCAAMAAAVHKGTLVHPFMLADNRHYVFYLWRRVVNRRWWARYALVPLYACSLAQLSAGVAGKGPLWTALFAVSTCLAVVPAHLVEFRYFTVPFCILVLNMRTSSAGQLAALAACYAAVNALTVAIYVGKPFLWVDGTIARFMW